MRHAHSSNLMCKDSETPIAKLTEQNVEAIKQLMIEGLNNQEIAEMFLVARGTISKIRDKKTWKHVLPNLVLPPTNSRFKKKGLSVETVRSIKKSYALGVSLSEIGRQNGLHSGTIHAIISGKSYRNVV